LKFILKEIKQLKKKPLAVGLQAFTCPSVLRAILESQNHVIFFDITPDYFSTLINDINFDQIDVLILTNLFGIPNPDYFKICEACKSRGIYVIDDLALTFNAILDGQQIGQASDACFFSFGFDKPISCYKGGLLKINNLSLAEHIIDAFNLLPQESQNRQIRDLTKLRVFYDLFDPLLYSFGSPFKIPDFFLLFSALLYLSSMTANRFVLVFFKVFQEFYHRFLSISPLFDISIPLLRMGDLKIDYLETLWGAYFKALETRLSAAEKAKDVLSKKFDYIVFPELGSHSIPSWHRFPILVPEDKRREIIDWGKIYGVEIGTFNWKALCFEYFEQFENLTANKFPYANRVRRQILNLPIWSDEIWNI
jgi:dTDP-4-amino-4,6-dideoxygalactose transaminase